MDTLILIDAVNAVPKDYLPELVPVEGIFLERSAARECLRMLAAAETEGITIKPMSGYRSSDYQNSLWERDIAEHMSDGLGYDEAVRLTSRYLAKPFHSEHETGLAVDLCTPECDDAVLTFAGTEQGRWLSANAHRFGFILRYPRMKEHITGIAYEPWHYRYVGSPHSDIMKNSGLTLEEYLYYYK